MESSIDLVERLSPKHLKETKVLALVSPGFFDTKRKTHTKTATPDRLCPWIIESMVKEPAGGFPVQKRERREGEKWK